MDKVVFAIQCTITVSARKETGSASLLELVLSSSFSVAADIHSINVIKSLYLDFVMSSVLHCRPSPSISALWEGLGMKL